MKINIQKSLKEAQALLDSDKKASPSMRAMLHLMITIIKLLLTRVNLDSHNSSLPPSKDRSKRNNPGKSDTDKSDKKNRKPGGQTGRAGTHLKPVDDPDKVIPVALDKRKLPKGTWTALPPEKRQVVDIEIHRIVTEYQIERIRHENGQIYKADSPEGVSAPIQYGASVKAHAVYCSRAQMIPYERLQAYFRDQCGIAMSTGSLVAFNMEAAQRLAEFEALARKALLASSVIHCDETGVNLAGKRYWQHSVSNKKWSLSLIDAKRGKEAMDKQGVLPHYRGTIVHDCWHSYYGYKHLTHALCGAHLLRECRGIFESNKTQIWAKKMQRLLQRIAYRKNRSESGILSRLERRRIYRLYDAILEYGKKQLPPPPITKHNKGRKPKSNEENLLVRMQQKKKEILRCIRRADVPFTNNAAERDIRMSKVQQKISGCFKNIETANSYAITRSFINSCNKQGIPLDKAFNAIFTKGAVKELFEKR